MSKAWIVGDSHGRTVIFARTKNEALDQFDPICGLLSDDPVVQRAKQYDRYAEAGTVPAEVLLQDGWTLSCAKCGEPVTWDQRRVGMQTIGDRAFCAMCVDEEFDPAQEGGVGGAGRSETVGGNVGRSNQAG